MQEVEFLVLVNDFLLHSERVERFASQGEYSLSLHVANFGDAATCRQTLGDENRREFAFVALSIVVVHAAVAEFFIVEGHLFGAFASLLGDAGDGFTLFFAILNLLQHGFGHLRLFVQEVVEFFFDEVVDEFVDCRPVIIHQRAAEFYLGL